MSFKSEILNNINNYLKLIKQLYKMNIQIVCFDFDGVFTDGKVSINKNNEIIKDNIEAL